MRYMLYIRAPHSLDNKDKLTLLFFFNGFMMVFVSIFNLIYRLS